MAFSDKAQANSQKTLKDSRSIGQRLLIGEPKQLAGKRKQASAREECIASEDAKGPKCRRCHIKLSRLLLYDALSFSFLCS